MKTCFICGRNDEPLDRHHIFGGAYRKKSEKMGLVVDLCHFRCHIFGEKAAHNCKETMDKLHRYGQKLAMEKYDMTRDEFIREFGRNYLDEEEVMTAVPTGNDLYIPVTEENAIARIDFLGKDGICDWVFYSDEESFRKAIYHETYSGAPMMVTLYEKDGKTIEKDYLYELDPPLRGLTIESKSNDFCILEDEEDDGLKAIVNF